MVLYVSWPSHNMDLAIYSAIESRREGTECLGSPAHLDDYGFCRIPRWSLDKS